MSNQYPDPDVSPAQQAMYERFENARESLTTAFIWALGSPDTVGADWVHIDEEDQELRVAELVEEIYSYAAAELELPTDFIDDCLTDAVNELDKLEEKE